MIEIVRQSLYTRDIQPTSKPLPQTSICGRGFVIIFQKRKLIYFLLANALIPPATKSIEAIITPDTSTIA